MAIAKAKCTCSKCGAGFEMTKNLYNRKEADSWAKAAPEYYTECPDCYANRKRTEYASSIPAKEEKLSVLNLPQISGVSDKQIAYANNLRREYAANYFYSMQRAAKIRDISDDKIIEIYRNSGIPFPEDSFEQIRRASAKARGLLVEYDLLTVSDARRIIELLKI